MFYTTIILAIYCRIIRSIHRSQINTNMSILRAWKIWYKTWVWSFNGEMRRPEGRFQCTWYCWPNKGYKNLLQCSKQNVLVMILRKFQFFNNGEFQSWFAYSCCFDEDYICDEQWWNDEEEWWKNERKSVMKIWRILENEWIVMNFSIELIYISIVKN